MIIGGTGFIGKHLINRCIKNKWQVTSVSLNPISNNSIIQKVDYLFFDIGKYNSILKNLKNKKFDLIINLGGHINHREKIKTYNSHYIGCKNLVRYSIYQNIHKFIQIGSSVEYAFSKSPIKENVKIKKNKINSIYGLSKFNATNFIKKTLNKINFEYYILRPFLVYGPGQSNDRLIPFIINESLKNNKFPCSKGNQIRDFLYVSDFIDLVIKCVKNKDYKKKNKIINVASGKPIKVKKLINLIRKLTKNGHPEFGKIKLRKDEPLKLYANISLAKKLFNWRPKISLKKGIMKTIHYYRMKNING